MLLARPCWQLYGLAVSLFAGTKFPLSSSAISISASVPNSDVVGGDARVVSAGAGSVSSPNATEPPHTARHTVSAVAIPMRLMLGL